MIALDVVCAAIVLDGAVLLAQRPAGKERALEWEFPGGKIEPGETPQEALERELQEELGIRVQVGECFATVLHDYADRSIRLRAFWTALRSGEPAPLECQAIAWIAPDELDCMALSEADRVVRDRLVEALAAAPARQMPGAER